MMQIFVASVLAILAITSARAETIKVAFVLSEQANVMDIAGPWEVFQDTMLDDDQGSMPFVLYTVAQSTAPINTSGSGGPGMRITPDYSFADAPTPDIVVVGAQRGGPELRAWITRQHAAGKTILSICTGAFELAQAGLLKGKSATTHHEYADLFAQKYPDTKLIRASRYVQSDPYLYTAGGLTSGIDLSLHIVASYFGEKQARRTADFLEYSRRP